jgi:hypothetical protein
MGEAIFRRRTTGFLPAPVKAVAGGAARRLT